MNENETSKILVDIFLQVYRKLGPGLLANFNVELIKDGITRVVNNL